MKRQCLLIKTQDNRKFLTYKKNLRALLEFAQTFNTELYVVIPKDYSQVLDLPALSAALCNQTALASPAYVQPKMIYPRLARERRCILAEASRIRSYIKGRLLAGRPVSLKQIKSKYKNNNLTDACLCNHLAVVRKTLAKEGYRFQKLGAGVYCLSSI